VTPGAGASSIGYCLVFAGLALSSGDMPCMPISVVSAFFVILPGSALHGLETGSLWYVIPAVAAP
jgi:hypothetical protein